MTIIRFEGKLNIAVFVALLCNAALGGWYANMLYSRITGMETSIRDVKKGGDDNASAINDLKLIISNLSGKIDTLLEQRQAMK